MCSLNRLWCIYIGLAHYYSIAIILLAIAIILTSLYSYITLTQCTRAIASTLIHAVVVCESAQRYRALIVILQSHRTQNMILRCYPTVSAILQRYTKSCLLCFFNNPYISPYSLFTCHIRIGPLFNFFLGPPTFLDKP